MSSHTQTIYFDESGYTGNNLLHEYQEYFAYGSVASDPDEAREFVCKVIKDFRVQAPELKGGKLVRYNNGRKLIDHLLTHFDGRIKVSISDKRYALACKFYEYIFEPCISESGSVFYGIGFHEFIANLLYLEFKSSNAVAEEIFANFERVMRSLDGAKVADIFPVIDASKGTGVLSEIAEFTRIHRNTIAEEINGLAGDGVGKWILDLSNTCLYTLLANWGLEHKRIKAICDDSQPLLAQPEIFAAMVNREGGQEFTEAFGRSTPVTFNLAEPVIFANSKAEYGIQLADVVSAAFVYAITNPDDSLAMKWRSKMPQMACYGSIFPDFDLIDLRNLGGARNAMVLKELVHRSKEGESLTSGIGKYVGKVTAYLTYNMNFK